MPGTKLSVPVDDRQTFPETACPFAVYVAVPPVTVPFAWYSVLPAGQAVPAWLNVVEMVVVFPLGLHLMVPFPPAKLLVGADPLLYFALIGVQLETVIWSRRYR